MASFINNKKIHVLASIFTAFLVLAGCRTTDPYSGTISQQTFSVFTGLKLGNIDRSVRPQDDLYRYASGLWLKGFELPSDRPSFAVFNSLVDEVQISQREYLTGLMAMDRRELRIEERKLLDLFASYMNVEAIDNRGLLPIKDFLDRIGDIETRTDLVAYFGHLSGFQMNHPFFLFIEEDPADPRNFLFHLEQAGLGMPGRDFYLDTGAGAEETRTQYQGYAETLFSLAGFDDAEDRAANVLRLETALAQFHWPLADTRDRNRVLNVGSRATLEALAPGFDWNAYFSSLGTGPGERLVIRQPDYFAGLSTILEETPIGVWRDYLIFHLLNDVARYLPEAFVEARFNFFQGALMDVNTMTPRNRRAFNILNIIFRDVLAQAYVRDHYDPSIHPMVETIAANLKQAFRQRLLANTWMSAETKANALAKLDSLAFQIGMPEIWIDYGPLQIKQDELIENVLNFYAFDFNLDVKKTVSGPPLGIWIRAAQTVNAFYNPAQNEIVVPLGLLQAPIFDPTVDMAANYGALGAIIGHEIIHAFDDQGRQFDEAGRHRDWWDMADADFFNATAERLAERYSQFSPLPGIFVNGHQTLGENIGDVEGLALAYDAFQLTNGGSHRQMAGFSGEQRLFLAWAQLWARVYQDAELHRQGLTSLHSPAEFRVNGPVQNIDGFYDAFNVVPGDALYLPPDERIRIW